MTKEEAKDIKVNDYLYFRFKEYDNAPHKFYVGFVTSEVCKQLIQSNYVYAIKIYSELCITPDSDGEWDLDEFWIPIGDIYQKLELETLQEQLIRKYSSILI